MEPFRNAAFCAINRDSALLTFAGGMLMVAFSYQLDLAFSIGASVALLFAVVLLCKVGMLTEERVLRSEAWRSVPPGERPRGHDGRRWARDDLEDLHLRFAKGAAGIAVALYASALVTALS